MISAKGKLNLASLTEPSAISYTCLYSRAALGEKRKAVWPRERERNQNVNAGIKAEKCREQQ